MTQALKKGTQYTLKDYLGWSDEERWEIIKGVAYDMTPAPSIMHQSIGRRSVRYF